MRNAHCDTGATHTIAMGKGNIAVSSSDVAGKPV